MKKQRCFIFVMLFFVQSFAFAQTYTMNAGANGSFSTCSGTFVDIGGSGGNYTGNQNSTITICPSTPGDVIKINFTSFDTQGGGGTCTDFLDIWYANAVGAVGTQDDRLCGPLGTAVIISTSPSGCISFQFTSNNSNHRPGWVGNISCVTPCGALPTSALADNSTLNLCPPASLNPASLNVAFDASPSTVQAGRSVARYDWEWGDGTFSNTVTPTTTHTYPSSGVFTAKLFVRDNNFDIDPLGCKSTISTVRIIKILPVPVFTGTTASPVNIACNTSTTLTGLAGSQTATTTVPSAVAGVTALPDGSGDSYFSGIDYSGFFPLGATVTSACYPTVTIKLDHSWSGDLTIDLIAPTGEMVRLYNRHGGGIHFGTCTKAADDGVPGCGGVYTIVNSGGVAWTAGGVTTTATSTCAPGYTGACESGSYYKVQTYNSSSPFAALDGADLNGVWTIKITDNLNLDDGTLFSWGITFPVTCYAGLETVTPDMSTAVWSHSGSGPAVPAQATTSAGVTDPGPGVCPNPGTCLGNKLTNSITVGPFNPAGAYVYDFLATDEFGCQYRQSITVNVGVCPAAVPITLVSFTGEVFNNQNKLYWETAAEADNNYFEIERSKDGKFFNSIANIKGAGNSNLLNNYNYEDRDPGKGLSYYRLKQVDNSGKAAYSTIISLENTRNSAPRGIKTLHPNPLPKEKSSLDIVYISETAAEAIFIVRNMLGQELYKKNVLLSKGENSINISLGNLNLNSGTHFIQVQTESGTEAKRFMVEKE